MSPRVILEPFDGDSNDHVERLHAMVEEMGWSQDRTGPIIQEHRDGIRAIFWIVLDPNDPASQAKLNKLATESDIYKIPMISRSANTTKTPIPTTAGLGELPSSSPTPLQSFIPIGNVGLSTKPLSMPGVSTKPLNPPPADTAEVGKTLTFAGFYVSRSLQGNGIGTAALSALADVARAPPLSAKALVLYVLSKETHDQEGLYASINRPMQVSKQDFYKRRGFEVYEMVFEEAHPLPGGGTWPIKWAYMRKMLGGE